MPYEVKVYTPGNIIASLVHDPTSETFHACIDCVSTTETRYCDGSTFVSWSLCRDHPAAAQAEKHELLDTIRPDIYRGLIPKPASKFMFRRMIPKPQLGRGFGKAVAADNHARGWTSDPDGDTLAGMVNLAQSDITLWPTTSVIYKHIGQCIHGSNVEYKIARNGRLISRSNSICQPDRTDQVRNTLRMEKEDLLAMAALDNRGRRSDMPIRQTCPGDDKELVFFRRCNGDFVNVDGKTLVVRSAPLSDHATGGKVDAGISEEVNGKTEQQVATRDQDCQESNGDDLIELSFDQVNHHSTVPVTDADNNCNVSSRVTSAPSGHHLTTTTLSLPSPNSSTNDPTSLSPLSSTSAISSPSITPQPSNPDPAHPATPSPHKLPLPTLMAREQLVHIGTVDATDLIATCWMWQRESGPPHIS